MKNQQKMIGAVALFMVLSFVLLPASSTSDSPTPVCTGSREPVALTEPLGFCGRTAGISCCNAMDDAKLREQFKEMNISDAACAANVQAFLCTTCTPYLSALLFHSADPETMTKLSVPLLCASAQQHPEKNRSPQRQHDTVCLEKISTDSFLGMAAHPDGSDRVFLPSRDGRIWLATMPERGSGGALRVDEYHHPFLDLRDRVLELASVAFHPEYAANGRFFVSYYTSPGCSRAGGHWGAAAGNGSRPCRYLLVVAEFAAEGGADYSEATRAHPFEVRRIFTLDLPDKPHTSSYSYQQHGGQILFQPSDSDGYLYLITGHGDFSKNGRSFLGKIIRFDVGGITGGRTTGAPRMGKPDMFTLGLNNPGGCSFDSERPSSFYCANVDQQQKEKVYLITNKAGRHNNFSSINTVFYNIISHGHPTNGRMPSIVGGHVYRGSADPWLKGRYMYMYASAIWIGMEVPAHTRSNRGYSFAQISNVKCSMSSPIPCHGRGGTVVLGLVLSFSEDNSKDVFILTTGGIYRVVAPGLCRATPQPPQWPPGTGWVLSSGALAVAFALYLIWSIIFGGGATIEMSCCNGWWSRNSHHYYRNGEHQD